jgi:hypothetical protein
MQPWGLSDRQQPRSDSKLQHPAYQLEGFAEIPARRVGALSLEELRALELEENLHRKDLTPYEHSKTMTALVAVAQEVAARELCGNFPRNSGPGRPVEPGSLREVAERIGVSARTLRDAQRHVAAVEEFPELAGVSQHEALEVAQELRQAPAPHRAHGRRRARGGRPAAAGRLQAVASEMGRRPPAIGVRQPTAIVRPPRLGGDHPAAAVRGRGAFVGGWALPALRSTERAAFAAWLRRGNAARLRAIWATAPQGTT